MRHGGVLTAGYADGLTENQMETTMADDTADDSGTTTVQLGDPTGDSSQGQQTAQEPNQPGKTLTQDEVDRLIADRLSRERKKFVDYDALKKKAGEFDKLQDAQKSEVEKLNERLAAAEVELQGHRVAEVRRAAAIEAGLDPGCSEFITAADEKTALEQAKRLAQRMAPPEPARADFRQGIRTQPAAKQDNNALLRRMAGY